MSSQTTRLAAVVLLLAGTAFAQPVLRLKNRLAGRATYLESSDGTTLKRRSLTHRHVVVQFPEAPRAEQIEALKQRGARILQPVPDFGFLISAPDGMEMEGLGLYQASTLHAGDKLSPALEPGGESAPRARFLAEFYPDVEPAEAREIAHSEGLRILDNPDVLGNHLLLEGDHRQMLQLAAWDEVAYVFPASEELENGIPVQACAGAITDQGRVGQYVAKVGEGWDGPGKNAAELGYSFEKLTEQVPREQAEAEIQRALAEWAKYVKLTFTRGSNPTARRNLNILYGSGSHGCPFSFDGPGKILAHTFYPAPPNPESIAGDLHFDEDENWRTGLDQFSVVLHELGHALGLGHSDNPGAVMYPYYRRAGALTEEDIAAIRELYASREADSNPAEPLQLSVQQPAGSPVKTTAETITVSGTASGGTGELRVTWASDRSSSGTATGSRNWTIAAAPLALGANVITVTVTDAGQAQVARSITVVREEAVVLPVVRISTPVTASAYTTNTASLTVSGTASHPAGIARISWSNTNGLRGEAAGAAQWSAGPIPLSEGSNTITVTAAATTGSSASQSLRVEYKPSANPPANPNGTPGAAPDKVAPALTILSPATSNVLTASASIVFRGTARDNVAVTQVSWATNSGGGGIASGTENWSTPEIPLLKGINTITVRAHDAAGNSSWRSVVVTRR